MVRDAGHEVAGLDAFLFEGCALGPEPAAVPARRVDVREVEIDDLRGFHAVVHLAALSNDPLGYLDPARTLEVNHLGSVRIARLARRAGVRRFVFASSCSLYGAASSSGTCRRWPMTTSARRSCVTPPCTATRLASGSTWWSTTSSQVPSRRVMSWSRAT